MLMRKADTSRKIGGMTRRSASQQVVDLLDDFTLRRAGQEFQGNAVERAIEVEQRGQRLLRHPQDGKPAVVGHQVAGTKRIDKLRREGDAHNLQLALLAVKKGLE